VSALSIISGVALLGTVLVPSVGSSSEPVSRPDKPVAGQQAQSRETLRPMGHGNLREIAQAGAHGRSSADPATANPDTEIPPVKRPR